MKLEVIRGKYPKKLTIEMSVDSLPTGEEMQALSGAIETIINIYEKRVDAPKDK